MILVTFLCYCQSLSLGYLLIFFFLSYFSLYNSLMHIFLFVHYKLRTQKVKFKNL